MKNIKYVQNYTAFMDSFTEKTSAVEVATLTTALASEFVSLNLELVLAERVLSNVSQENESATDVGGKAISSAKAKVMTDSTEEASAVRELKAHKENLRVMIASLDSLQRAMAEKQ